MFTRIEVQRILACFKQCGGTLDRGEFELVYGTYAGTPGVASKVFDLFDNDAE